VAPIFVATSLFARTSGYTNGFYDEIINFFRNLFTSGLKDNSFLHKGVLTGVLRVAKESLFSGLNNLEVHGVLSSALGVTAFGFTDPEVVAITQAMGQPERMEEIRHWYDGYRTLDGQSLFNPWSVLNYASKPQLGLQPYWVQRRAPTIYCEARCSSTVTPSRRRWRCCWRAVR